VFSTLQDFITWSLQMFNTKVQFLKSDSEYMDGGFQSYMLEHGILHQTSVNTSNQNGVAKWKNKYWLDVYRSLMFTRNFPKPIRGDAVLTRTYLINRIPLRVLKFITPMDFLQGTCSYIVPEKTFWCVSFVRDHWQDVGKLDPWALKYVFIEYSTPQTDYKCYHPPSIKIFVSMDVTFHENESYLVNSPQIGDQREWVYVFGITYSI
jgi:hypothetical protein